MRVRVTITAYGRVSAACIEQATFWDREAVACVLHEFELLKFAPAAQDEDIVVPIQFRYESRH
jgi:hypothetical protein